MSRRKLRQLLVELVLRASHGNVHDVIADAKALEAYIIAEEKP